MICVICPTLLAKLMNIPMMIYFLLLLIIIRIIIRIIIIVTGAHGSHKRIKQSFYLLELNSVCTKIGRQLFCVGLLAWS